MADALAVWDWVRAEHADVAVVVGVAESLERRKDAFTFGERYARSSIDHAHV